MAVSAFDMTENMVGKIHKTAGNHHLVLLFLQYFQKPSLTVSVVDTQNDIVNS